MKKVLGSVISTLLLICLVLTMTCAKADTTLKLNGIMMQYAGDFTQLHPDVLLKDEDYHLYETTGEMTGDLLLGNFDYDLFELRNICVDYRTIMDKGFCLDLSSSPVIQDVMRRLYPAFAERCMVGKRIYAIPCVMQMNYLSISVPDLEKAGFKATEAPSTFPEFLDFLEDWIAFIRENPAADVALLGKSYWGDESFYNEYSYTAFLVDQLLDNCMMQKEYAGEQVSFDREELVPLLNECLEIGRELYLYDRGVKCSSAVLKEISNIPRNDCKYLSLRLNNVQPKLIPIYLTLYAANAETKDPALCIELMEKLCLNNWPLYNTYFYQNSEPLPDPQYDSEVSSITKMIQQTEKQLENVALEAGYRADLQERLEDQKTNLQNLLENEDEKYLVTEDELQFFRSYADCLFVPMPGPFHANDAENANAFKQMKARFSTGLITADELLNDLNQMAWMIEMEAE